MLNGQQPVLHISLPRHTLELYDHDVSPMVISETEGRHLQFFFKAKVDFLKHRAYSH